MSSSAAATTSLLKLLAFSETFLTSATPPSKCREDCAAAASSIDTIFQLHVPTQALSLIHSDLSPEISRWASVSGILPAIDLIGKHILVGIFYFIGFGHFCLESVISVWVIQQVYMYFKGSGKANETRRREAARGALRATI